MCGGGVFSQGEKPPKIREKKFPGTKFLGTFGPPPTEKTEKIGKIKGTLVGKVPGNLRSQEFVFFFLGGFSAPYTCKFGDVMLLLKGSRIGIPREQVLVRNVKTSGFTGVSVKIDDFVN